MLKSPEAGRSDLVISNNHAMETLTKAQKREIDLIKKGGGWMHVFDGRLLRVYWALQEKGYVEISSAFGQFQKGHHVKLIK